MAGTIGQIREKYPQYSDLSDQALADALHKKFYADMDQADFYGRIGLNTAKTGDFSQENIATTQTAIGPSGKPAPVPGLTVPSAADALPPQPRVDPLVAAMSHDAMPAYDGTTPKAPPLPNRADDPMPVGMMGGSSEDQVMWARRDIARRAAASGEILRPRAAAVPDRPQKDDVIPDPFAGEGAAALLQRRGQQFAQGAAGVIASVPRSIAEMGTAREMTEQKGARDTMNQRVDTIAAIREKLADPSTDDVTKVFLQQNLDDLLQGQKEIQGRIDAPILPASERPIYAKGDVIQGMSDKIFGMPDPRDHSFWGKAAQGVGSTAGFALATTSGGLVAGPGGALAAGGGLGAMANADQAYQDAKAAGTDEETAIKAAKWGSLIGTSEVLPITHALKILPAPLRAKVGGLFYKTFLHIAESAGEEAAQEWGQQVAGNIRDQQLYDPNRGWTDGATENALIGAISGGGFGAVGAGLNRGHRSETGAVPQKAPHLPSRPFTPTPPPSPADPIASAMTPDAASPTEPPAPPPAPPAAQSGADATVDVSQTPSGARQVDLSRADAPQSPPADASKPVEKINTPEEAASQVVENAKNTQIAQNSNFEVMDEIETIDGLPRPTGRRVRVNLDTGEAEVVQETPEGGTSPADGSPGPAGVAGPQPQEGDGSSVPASPAAEPIPASTETAPAPTASAHDPQGRPAPQRVFLNHDQTLAIQTDPKNFQYKGGTDAEGVSDRLRGATRFDPNRAGQAVLFQRLDGTLVVADGHQRTGLARRSAESGQSDVGGMAAVIYREADGYTPQEVMTEAALKNIGEDSGTATDAARVLRAKKESISELGLPPNSAKVRTADGLRRLNDQAFGMVANGVASERDGAAVGRNVTDPALQADVLALLTRLKPENEAQAAMIARDAASSATTETQDSLFGPETTSQSLYGERAKVLDAALKGLGKNIATFRTLVDRAETITGAGNRLAKDQNAARVDDDTKVRQYLSAQSNMKGPISDALTEAARLVRSGTPVARAAEGFVRDAKGSLDRSGPAGQGTARGGSADAQDAGRAGPGRDSGQLSAKAEPKTPDVALTAAMRPAPATPSQETGDAKPQPVPQTPEGDLFAAMAPAGKPNPAATDTAKVKPEAPKSASQIAAETRKPGAGTGRQTDLFDQKGARGAGERQTDIEDLIAEKKAEAPTETVDGLIAHAQAFEQRHTRYGQARAPTFFNMLDTVPGRALLKSLIGKSTEERHALADQWVLARGKATGNEHLVIFDKDGNVVVIGSGDRGNIGLDDWVMDAGASGELAHATHNHPNNGGFSVADYDIMAINGLSIVAVGHDGHRHAARTGPAFGGKAIDTAIKREDFREAVKGIEGIFHAHLQSLITAANLTAEEFTRIAGLYRQAESGMVSLALHRMGVIVYDGDGQRAVDAAGVNLDELYDAARTAALPDLRRAGLSLSTEGNQGQDRGTRSDVSDATSTGGTGTGAIAPEGGNRSLRLPQDNQSVTASAGVSKTERPADEGGHRGDARQVASGDSERSDQGNPGSGDRTSGKPAEDGLVSGRDLNQQPAPNSEAFKRWFGASKVVDAKGNPLVVYHGTPFGDFEMFDTFASKYGLMGQGGYFTEDPSISSQYSSKGAKLMGRRGDSPAPTVYPVYLTITNPIDMESSPNLKQWANAYSDYVSMDDLAEAKTNEEAYRIVEDALTGEMLPDYEGAEIIQDGLQGMGFDGITHIGGGRVSADGPKHRVWIAFRPEQIKSAYNRGTFDPSSVKMSHQAAKNSGSSGVDRRPVSIGDAIIAHDLATATRHPDYAAANDPSGLAYGPTSRYRTASDKTPTSHDAIRAMFPRLRAELNRLGLSHVPLYFDNAASDWQGTFLRYSKYDMEIIVGAALDPMNTVRHEAIHALRNMDLFNDQEWRALEQKAVTEWMAKYDIEGRYPGLELSDQIEEAIAEAFAEFDRNADGPAGSLITRAFRKMEAMFEAFRNALHGAGFQTAEDVFGKVDSGEVGQRPDADAETATGELALAQKRQAKEPDPSGLADQIPSAPMLTDEQFATIKSDLKSAGRKDPAYTLSEIPPVLRKLRVDQRMIIRKSVFEKARDKHGLSEDETMNAVRALYSPVMVFDSDTTKDAFMALVEIGNGKTMVVAIHPDAESGRMAVSSIASVYAKTNAGIVPEWMRKGLTRYMNKRSAGAWFQSRRLQLPREGTAHQRKIKILQHSDVFKSATPGQSGPTAKFQAARLPSRQARAHMATAMQGALYIPDRHIWEELNRTGAPIWERLHGGVAAAHDLVDRIRIKLQDRFLPVLRAQQAVERMTGAPLKEQYDAYLVETTFSGKAGRHLFDIDEKFTKKIVSLIAETNGDLTREQVSDYLTARHAEERNDRIAKINPKMPDGGSGMTTAEAQKIMENADAGPHAQRLAEIGNLIDGLRDWSLKLRVDAGLMTQAEADLWRAQYDHYVPLKGFDETEHTDAFLDATGVGRRFNVRGDETKRALGRQSRSFNVLQAAITQAQEVAIRAEKARVGAALYRLARDFPSKAMWEVKKVETRRVFNKTTGLVETRPVDPLSMIMQPNELAVKVDGEEYRIVFHDPRLARSAGSVGADQMGWFIKALSMMGRWFSATRTMMNPEFMITNAFRDMTAAQINIQSFGDDDKAALARGMIKNWRKAFMGVYRGQENQFDTEWSRYYDEFTRAGAKVEFWHIEQPEAGLKDMDRRIWLASGPRAARIMKRFVSPSAFFSTRDNGVLHFIERTNMAIDNAIRLAAFVEARKSGWSEAKAAALSRNLTVNFNRRGEAGPTMNALYTFFNASVQGTATTARALITSKRVRYMALAMIAAGFLNDMSNAYLSHKDDDGVLAYDKIPDFQNQRAVQFMLGRDGENALSIPMPYGYNIFPYIGQQIGKVSRGVKDPDRALLDFATATMGAFSPVQGGDVYSFFAPTVIDPFLEMARNLDWLGRPIKPDFSGDLKPESQKFFGGASEISKEIASAANSMTGGSSALSGWLDVSPEYIDHTASFIFGSMGDFAGRSVDLVGKAMTGKMDDVTVNDVPMLRTLIKDTYPGLDRDRYFRFRDMVERAQYAVKQSATTGEAVPDVMKKWASLGPTLKAAEKRRKDGEDIFEKFNAKVTETFGAIGE